MSLDTKILQFHVDHIEYRPIKKELSSAEDIDPVPRREEDLLVLFTAVEKGDDEKTATTAINDLKKFADNLKVKKIMIYPFAHLSQNLSPPKQAFEVLRKMEEESKAAGLETSRAPFGWNKALEIKVKGHPLAEMSRNYGASSTVAPKQVEETRPRRQLSEHELMARIQRSDFGGLPETDHRVIGQQMDLFSFQEPSPGMVYWHRNGLILFETLKNFLRKELSNLDYQEISTPSLANTLLWEVSGHNEHYKDNMFLTKLGDEEFGLKPMNCPSTFLVYRSKKWSYRDLPVKYSIFDPLYRNELSGVASGLFRVKILTQDDAHIITTREDGAAAVEEVIALMERVYSVFKLPFKMKLSTRPDDSMGSEEEWDEATAMLRGVLERRKIDYEVKDKEGNFYAPKIDVDIRDSIGREWQCCTIQADFQMPKKFKLSYVGEDGRDHTPIVIHRTILGSLERFIGVIIEHYKGRLPLWLSPVQARVIPVSDSNVKYARSILTRLKGAGLRADGDFETGTMSQKIKVAQIQKVPYMFILGEKEEKGGRVSLRTREGEKRFDLGVEELVGELKEKAETFQ